MFLADSKKEPLLGSTSPRQSEERLSTSARRSLKVCLALLLAIWVWAHTTVVLKPGSAPVGWGKPVPSPSWNSSKPIFRSPNATLGWHVCPDNPANLTFLCAVFETPLNWLEVTEVEGEKDWRNWTGGDKVVDKARIFLRMYPAKKDRLGSILFNPGGPGGSGSSFIYRNAEEFANVTEGRFDLIGFDPRGVNMTYPHLKTHDTLYDRAVFDLANPPPINAGDPTNPANTSRPDDYEREYARLSEIHRQHELNIALVKSHTTEKERKSVSTPFVVRDMAAIVDALGEKDGLLNYWGFSYGTILGAHFAAIFPERVGRLVFDGVSHSGDYTHSLAAWGRSSMTDTFATFEQFFIECIRVGEERCPLASRVPASKDAHLALMIKMGEFLNGLWQRPLVVADSKIGPGLVTSADVSLMFGMALYEPTTWQGFARGINDAMDGNGTTLRDLLPSPWYDALVADPKTARKNETDNVFGLPGGDKALSNAVFGILCSDEEPVTPDDLESFIHLNEELRLKSPLGNMWTWITSGCMSWTDRPYERYPGPWTRKDGLRKTKNPVLWIGNTYDPVTPLQSAKRMAAGFGADSARVLVHDGRGHCSTAEPSLCTAKAIRDYFVRGILPAEGTVCKAEDGFIFPKEKDKNKAETETATIDMVEEDAELWEALQRIAHDRGTF